MYFLPSPRFNDGLHPTGDVRVLRFSCRTRAFKRVARPPNIIPGETRIIWRVFFRPNRTDGSPDTGKGRERRLWVRVFSPMCKRVRDNGSKRFIVEKFGGEILRLSCRLTFESDAAKRLLKHGNNAVYRTLSVRYADAVN